jgi:hypothetical protein
MVDSTQGGPRQQIPLAGSVEDTLRARYGADVQFGEPKLGVGEYHPRIWRRLFSPPPNRKYARERVLSVQAARNLFADMRDVFRCVEPSMGSNSHAYGHRIRELLTLACIEVESAWKSVLFANNYKVAKPTTNDYAKLLTPMRLDEWELALPTHPTFPSFKPFHGWDPLDPTKTLDWYNRYNLAKHGRESSFHEATLGATVYALGAVWVMVAAQFGPWLHVRETDWEDESAWDIGPQWSDEFAIVARPKWKQEDFYAPPFLETAAVWTPKPLFP